jgi:thiol-disulfide isomerase/thioredoxin
MNRKILLLTAMLGMASLTFAQTIPGIDRDDISRMVRNNSDTTYVINFWATWCSPCVKEIGYFEDLHREYAGDPVQVILVSLDFPNQKDRRVLPFIEEKQLSAPVLLVTDLDYNGWIDLVDPSWSGSLPATLIYRGDKKVFLEKELTKNELNEHFLQILN